MKGTKLWRICGCDLPGELGIYIDTLPKTNSSHLKIGRLPRKKMIVFQPSIFRCELLVYRSGRLLTFDQIPKWKLKARKHSDIKKPSYDIVISSQNMNLFVDAASGQVPDYERDWRHPPHEIFQLQTFTKRNKNRSPRDDLKLPFVGLIFLGPHIFFLGKNPKKLAKLGRNKHKHQRFGFPTKTEAFWMQTLLFWGPAVGTQVLCDILGVLLENPKVFLKTT